MSPLDSPPIFEVIWWIWDWAKYHISHTSKSIKVTKLSFGQNDLPKSTSFWQKNSLVTLILFELWPLCMIFRPVSNSSTHTLILNKVFFRYAKGCQHKCTVNYMRIPRVSIIISIPAVAFLGYLDTEATETWLYNYVEFTLLKNEQTKVTCFEPWIFNSN